METPVRVGEPKVLLSLYRKEFITEDFFNPKTGETYTYALIRAGIGIHPVIVFPVTMDKKVIATRQFRHAAKDVLIELPGGNPKGNQTDVEIVESELKEETGYAPGRIVQLCPAMWWEPDGLRLQYGCYLATDCVKVGKLQLDDIEYIEAETFDLRQWIEMIWEGKIIDSKTIVLTMLALPHLGISLQY